MFGVVVPGVGEVGLPAGAVVPGVVLGVVVPGLVVAGFVVDPGLPGVVSGVVLPFGPVCGVGVVVVFGFVPGVVAFGFWFVGAGVGAAVLGVGAAVPGCDVPVWPVVPWPDIEPEVWPEFDPAEVPAVPAPPVDPAVCSAAIITGCDSERAAVGPVLDGEEDGVELLLVHWSATLVALVTLNVLPESAADPEFAVAVPPAAVALELEPLAEDVALWSGVLAFAELIPELAPAPCCPVTCTSLPISVRTAFRSPVNL